MKHISHSISKDAGLPPGQLTQAEEHKECPINIKIFDYNEDIFEEIDYQKLDIDFRATKKNTNRWVNITGIGRVDVIEEVGKQFNIHPLLLEDIMNTAQRPELQQDGDSLFLVVKIILWDQSTNDVEIEQFTIIQNANIVVTFQENENYLIDRIIERVQKSIGKIRSLGSDFLVYSLLDVIIDNYFDVLERTGEKIEGIEEKLVENPSFEISKKIHRLKREIIALQKSIWPVREIVNSMQRGDLSMIQESTLVYLRDLYDHTIQVIDTIENFRDLLSGMLDVFLSSLGNKTNDIMKLLTIVSTIFIPITFIEGLYGMNFFSIQDIFDNFLGVIIVMIAIAVVMLIYFRKRKWI